MFAIEPLLNGEIAPLVSYSIDCGILNLMLVVFRTRFICSLRL